MRQQATAVRGPFGKMQAHAVEAASLLKAMSNEYRLLILCHLAEGELSVGELNDLVDISQSSLSQHLGVLRQYGLVDTRRESQTIYYRLAHGPAMQVMESLYDAYCAPARGGSRRR